MLNHPILDYVVPNLIILTFKREIYDCHQELHIISFFVTLTFLNSKFSFQYQNMTKHISLVTLILGSLLRTFLSKILKSCIIILSSFYCYPIHFIF